MTPHAQAETVRNRRKVAVDDWDATVDPGIHTVVEEPWGQLDRPAS